eukprot:3196914-Pyramimonas_sp.AAC.1
MTCDLPPTHPWLIGTHRGDCPIAHLKYGPIPSQPHQMRTEISNESQRMSLIRARVAAPGGPRTKTTLARSRQGPR